METDTLLQIVNSGIGVVSLFILNKLWEEYKAQNMFIRELLLHLQQDQRRAATERYQIADKVGVAVTTWDEPVTK